MNEQEQSNDAKAVCIKCGTNGDSTMNRCGRCKSVFYCSRDCQVGHWKEHKQNCYPAATPAPAAEIDLTEDQENRFATEKVKCSSMGIVALRKELHEKFKISTESFVEKSEFIEALAKARAMKKLVKEITTTATCQNCTKVATNMHECSRCWNAHYCSKECQSKHWPQHKENCRKTTEAQEQIKASGGKRLNDMFSMWRQQSRLYILNLAGRVMSNKQFKMQPPNFVVDLEVDFNYNYQTFLPLAPPSITMLEDYPPEFRAILKEAIDSTLRAKEQSPDVYFSHVVCVSCRGIPAVMPANLHPSLKKQSIDDVYTALKHDVKVSSSYYKIDQYRSLQMQNLNEQMNAARRNGAFGLFTHHVFRMYSRESRHKTHAIVLFIDFDFGLGQVKTFTRYEAKPLGEMKALIQQGAQSEVEKQTLISKSLDVENSPALLQSRIQYPHNVLLSMFVIDSATSLLLSVSSFTEILDHSTMSVKASDREAEKQFRLLQKFSFRPILNSPSLRD